MKKHIEKWTSYVLIFILVCFCLSLLNIGCQEKNKRFGNFYTLKEAYSKGILTESNLFEIAFYYQGENFSQKENSLPLSLLDENMQKRIKESYKLNVLERSTISIEYINIYAYYGTYNGSIAIGITDTYNVYDKLILTKYEVGTVSFYNYAESDIRIWIED